MSRTGDNSMGGDGAPVIQPPTPVRSHRIPPWLYGLVALLVVAAGWWLVQTYRAINGPQQAATAFLKTASDQGSLASYGSAAPAFQDTMTTASWQAMVTRLRLSAFYYADWQSYDTNGDAATVRGVIKRLNLPDLTATIDLRKIGDHWKVAMLSVDGDQGAAAPSMPTAAPPVVGTQAQVRPAPATLPSSGAEGSDASVAPAVPVAPPPSDTASAPVVAQAVAAGQLGPICLGQLAAQGMSIDRVRCKGDLPARIGADQLCYAHIPGGPTVYASVFYNGIDPVTRQPVVSCRMVH